MSKLLKLEEGVQDITNSLDVPLNVVEDVVIAGVNNSGLQENDEASLSFSRLSSGGNPLQNPVIRQHLFQLCPASILASCRLVCKEWYDESLLTWRTAFPLIITLRNENEIFLIKSFTPGCTSDETIITPFKEFLEFVSKPEKRCDTKPYRNFQIHSCSETFWVEKLSSFWISIGSNLTTLQLFNCTFRTVEEFREVIYKYCPILQSLQIIQCRFRTPEPENVLEYKEPSYGERPHLKSLYVKLASPDYGGNQLPVSWIELFSHFPCLTSLRLELYWFGNELPESEFENLMAAIRIIRKQDKSNLPLNCFQLPSKMRVSQEQFSVMKELRLPLKEFSIRVHPEMDVDFWMSLLEYNAPSMNTLTVERDTVDQVLGRLMFPPFFRQFPFGIHLPILQKFKSRGDLIESFDFLKYMPNLSELEVYGGSYCGPTKAFSNTCKEELANVEMRRLMTFKLVHYFVSDEDIQQLSKWMPYINNLEVVLGDGQFGIVCQSWRSLRKVTVFQAQQRTMEEIGKGKIMEKEVEIRPYIANLEGLESLNFSDIKLTPETFFNLFLYLPGLQILRDNNDPFKRSEFNTSSYRQAVEDNAVEQWIADHARGFGRRRRLSY